MSNYARKMRYAEQHGPAYQAERAVIREMEGKMRVDTTPVRLTVAEICDVLFALGYSESQVGVNPRLIEKLADAKGRFEEQPSTQLRIKP